MLDVQGQNEAKYSLKIGQVGVYWDSSAQVVTFMLEKLDGSSCDVMLQGVKTTPVNQPTDVFASDLHDRLTFWINANELVMLRYDESLDILCDPVVVATLGTWGSDWTDDAPDSGRRRAWPQKQTDDASFAKIEVLDSFCGRGSLVVAMRQCGDRLLVRSVQIDGASPRVQQVNSVHRPFYF